MSMYHQSPQRARRSPHGERGLKYVLDVNRVKIDKSLSSRRAWIEMIRQMPVTVQVESLSSRRAWIEIALSRWKRNGSGSLSSRRAWIEINGLTSLPTLTNVALLTESVD